jgi:hypothetical protein
VAYIRVMVTTTTKACCDHQGMLWSTNVAVMTEGTSAFLCVYNKFCRVKKNLFEIH